MGFVIPTGGGGSPWAGLIAASAMFRGRGGGGGYRRGPDEEAREAWQRRMYKLEREKLRTQRRVARAGMKEGRYRWQREHEARQERMSREDRMNAALQELRETTERHAHEYRMGQQDIGERQVGLAEKRLGMEREMAEAKGLFGKPGSTLEGRQKAIAGFSQQLGAAGEQPGAPRLSTRDWVARMKQEGGIKGAGSPRAFFNEARAQIWATEGLSNAQKIKQEATLAGELGLVSRFGPPWHVQSAISAPQLERFMNREAIHGGRLMTPLANFPYILDKYLEETGIPKKFRRAWHEVVGG